MLILLIVWLFLNSFSCLQLPIINCNGFAIIFSFEDKSRIMFILLMVWLLLNTFSYLQLPKTNCNGFANHILNQKIFQKYVYFIGCLAILEIIYGLAIMVATTIATIIASLNKVLKNNINIFKNFLYTGIYNCKFIIAI